MGFGDANNSLELFSSSASDEWLNQSDGIGGFCIFIALKPTALHSDWNDIFGNTSAVTDPGIGMRYSNSGKMQNFLGAVKLESSLITQDEAIIIALHYDASTEEGTFWDSKYDANITQSIPAAKSMGLNSV